MINHHCSFPKRKLEGQKIQKSTLAKLKADAKALALIIGFVYLNAESFQTPMAIEPNINGLSHTKNLPFGRLSF